MAFKFNCEHCGEELLVYYLKIGEEAQCTACRKQAVVPETAEYLDLGRRPAPQSRLSLPIKQDEERRREIVRERTRDEILRSPSINFVKGILDILWYGGLVWCAIVLVWECVPALESGYLIDSTLELPIRVRYHESPNLIPWEEDDGDTRAEGMEFIGHDFCIYQTTGHKWTALIVANMLLGYVLLMSATYSLRRVFSSIRNGRPFAIQNSIDLRRVGIIIAVWGPLYGAFDFFQGGYYGPWLGLVDADTSVELHLYPQLILVGLVIVAIAHLFELAARIQREQELTI